MNKKHKHKHKHDQGRGGNQDQKRRIGIAIILSVALVASTVVVISINATSFNPLNTETISPEDNDVLHDPTQLVMHEHAYLEVWIDGSRVGVPYGIGIETLYYRDHSLDEFGIREPQLMAPLHTHETDGIIHIESTKNRSFMLGEFLDIWGFSSNTTAKLTVDGKPVDDYRNHILKDGQEMRLIFQ